LQIILISSTFHLEIDKFKPTFLPNKRSSDRKTDEHPVAEYKNFTWEELVNEMSEFHNTFYSYQKILKRVFWTFILNWRNPYKVLVTLIANVTYLYNHMLDRRVYEERTYDNRQQQNLHTN